MLKHLHITNYVLIDKLDIDFHPKMNVVTGETGAGKSIILGALGLVLGERADRNLIKNQSAKFICEAEFKIALKEFSSLFEKLDLVPSEELMLRREISPNGNSRCFINESQVSLNDLKELSTQLIDIHSQNTHLLLKNTHFKWKVLDSFSATTTMGKKVKKLFRTLQTLKNTLSTLLEEQQKKKENIEYFEFLNKEFDAIDLNEEAFKKMEQKLNVFSHTKEIIDTLNRVRSRLQAEQNSPLDIISECTKNIQKIEHFSPKIQKITERLENLGIELTDLEAELEVLGNEFEFSESEFEEISQKANAMYALMSKHKVSKVSDLQMVKEKTDSFLNSVDSNENKIENLQKKIQDTENLFSELALKLSQKRQQHLPEFNNLMNKTIHFLGMENMLFESTLTSAEPSIYGVESLDFRISNSKISDTSVEKTLSGGEISRFVLAAKGILSQHSQLPSIIFDEIDVGVSGKIADKVGEFMLRISKNLQLIAVTHLPQIASKGQRHYKIFKSEEKNTQVEILDHKKRIKEIAGLLSGEHITKSALNHAKLLLESK